MTTLKLTFIVVSLVLLMTYNSYSQGCSDAGVCTMNSFKPNDEGNLNQTSNQIKFGISYGNAD